MECGWFLSRLPPLRFAWMTLERGERAGSGGCYAVARLRARPEIIESTFDRVRYGFTTDFPYHILWW